MFLKNAASWHSLWSFYGQVVLSSVDDIVCVQREATKSFGHTQRIRRLPATPSSAVSIKF
jgi:hypothetical protein